MTIDAKAFNVAAAIVYDNARAHGFWDLQVIGGQVIPKNQGEMIALIHSELSEALEGLRHGNPMSEHIPEFTSVEEELADVVIRVLDYAGGFGLRIGEAIAAKHQFNQARPHKHGGKAF